MANAAIDINHLTGRSAPTLRVLTDSRRDPSIMLLLTLITVQLADGALTIFGLLQFGYSIEANPLIAALFNYIPPIHSILLIKALALGTSIWAWSLCRSISWLPHILRLMIAVYVIAAIAPWGYILLG